ncbi:MAG: hypothetical protein QOK38_3964 [Acidobacteriaceae bacterium]|nr:hypothetical protein [Acidobacteriaceae bacterium]
MAHERFRRFNTMGRWPNQTIDYDVSLMVRATGRSVFIAGLTGFDLDGKFHREDDAAAQADQAMKNLKILVEEAGRTLEHVCKVTTYLGSKLNKASASKLVPIGYFAGCGGFGTPVSIRTFHFPPSRTYVAVQKTAASMEAPLWFLPVNWT